MPGAALRGKMPEWQEKSEGRIGNTAELFDAPIGHFSRSPKGRGPFGRWRCRSSLMYFLYTALLSPSQRAKIPSVAAMS
jgi:hypothetical protein